MDSDKRKAYPLEFGITNKLKPKGGYAFMSEYNEKEEKKPEEISPKSLLEELLREGARKMLQSAIEN